MAHFVSLLPAAAPLPAATPAAAPGQPDVLLPADLTSPNFLAQFKSALKSLAQAVVVPPATARPATDQTAGPVVSPILDQPAEDPAPAKAAVLPDSTMPQLLAELGFVVVPPMFAAPAAPTNAGPAAATEPTPGRVAQIQAPTQLPVPLEQAEGSPLAARPQLDPIAGERTHAQAAAVAAPDRAPAPDRVPVSVSVSDRIPTLAPAVPPGQATDATQALPQAGAILDARSSQPLAHLKPADQPPTPVIAGAAQPAVAAAPVLSAATVMLQPAPVAHQPTPAQPVATSGGPIVGPQPASHGGSQSSSTSSNSNGSHHTLDGIAPVSAESPAVQSPPASDGLMAAAAATAAPASGGSPPLQVGPSEVVSQIARNADLIRLPGNRGLKIQLHPDDLGGVQVTVRYSASGGVELHINAEHAATGALVQAGWTELRDALATQGISADRLMLSVTGPTGAGQADLSGGGGNRSDPNPSGSNTSQTSAGLQNQDGQSQSRQDTPQQRSSQSWSGPLDPISSPDGTPRAASAGAAPSRIDYRV